MTSLVDTHNHNVVHEDIQSWLALHQIPGLGNAGLCQLLAKFGSPEAIFNASNTQLCEIISIEIAQKIKLGIDIDAITPALKWLEKENTHLVTLADDAYPKQLLEISNPPALLYAIGNLNWLNHPTIAMVGSRSATLQGEKNAEEFAESLCNQGFCIVSGMAIGIDGAAHRGALKANGATIAVAGTGLDIVYPARHRDLAHQIAERGLIISEFPLGTPSKSENFPRRNRIISGLSLGCLVVEANIDSGSLITARLATEQGREVFAIPGSIHSPVAKGCHQLIKQGAKLVENTQDILEEINWAEVKAIHKSISPSGLMTHSGKDTLEASIVLSSMGFDPIDFHTLQTLTALTTEALSAMLILLELDDKVTVLSGGKYQRLV
jgi:DNA processing protein